MKRISISKWNNNTNIFLRINLLAPAYLHNIKLALHSKRRSEANIVRLIPKNYPQLLEKASLT